MKQNFLILLLLLCSVLWNSCKEEGNLYYMDKGNAVPESVTNIKVEGKPGGVNISYKVPNDKNLSYVKAVYEIQPGVFSEAISSFYKDTLSLVGFGDTLEYKVNIFSVGKNNKTSKKTEIKVKPLLPPIKTVYKTLTLDATFGGLNVTFLNEHNAELAFFVLTDTLGIGNWIPVTAYYSDVSNGKFSIRGLDAKEGKYAVYVRDRWNNKSDTLVKSLTPLFEELIHRSNFKMVAGLASDKNKGQGKNLVTNLFSGNVGTSGDLYKSEDDTYPQWFTMDMGAKVIFSRMKLFQPVQYPYVTDWVREFEILGSNELVDDISKWISLGRFESIKPSGLPDPSYTAADMDYERAGEDYGFEEGLPAVRYMRFKVIINRGGGGKFYTLDELTFWGQIEKKP